MSGELYKRVWRTCQIPREIIDDINEICKNYDAVALWVEDSDKITCTHGSKEGEFEITTFITIQIPEYLLERTSFSSSDVVDNLIHFGPKYFKYNKKDFYIVLAKFSVSCSNVDLWAYGLVCHIKKLLEIKVNDGFEEFNKSQRFGSLQVISTDISHHIS